jgi:SAM-dependent methyltransferase
MRLNNQSIEHEIMHSNAICLELGSGENKKNGYIGIDLIKTNKTDIIGNLNFGMPLIRDNSCIRIYSSHVLEHISNLELLMREIHRVIKSEGEVELIVPHFSNVFGYSDPTHVRFFGLYSMHYYCKKSNQPTRRKVPDFYLMPKFLIKSARIEFYNHSLIERVFNTVFERLVNINWSTKNFYERRLSSWIHARQIRFIIKKDCN